MIKRLHSTLFYASDLTKTSNFYEALGFDVMRSSDGTRIKLGDYTLAFIDEQKTPIQNESGATPKGLGVFSYVEVENVDVYFESLKAKDIETASEPKTWSWGKREFVVKDPDGYKIVFYSSVRQ